MTPNITALQQPVPPYLYKYRSLHPMKRIKQILADNRLWCSSPASFNDPFDCKVGSLGTLDQTSLKKMIKDTLETGVAPSGAEARLADGDRDAYKEVSVGLQKRVDRCGILSLCKHSDNILLWSHYADTHRGICLEFSTSEWPSLRCRALPVIYSRQRPSVNFTPEWDKKQFFQDIALTKHASWCYEKEWRFVELDGEGFVNFPATALTGVIFGCEVQKSKLNAVMRYIKKRTQRPAIYRAFRDEREFKLVLEQID